jgi:hypothetical protein
LKKEGNEGKMTIREEERYLFDSRRDFLSREDVEEWVW